ncbi:MAG: DUF4342 domain-containing protein [Bacillota bacterium]|jgi:hypothetical protein|nr:DUF4342 domain-containing protein [Candidatus Fermentithermobacillaceae bacterium]
MAFVLEKIRPIRRGRREASRSAGKTVIERLGRLAVATLRRGNRSRIVVSTENEVIVNTPVTAGILAALASPRLFLLGLTAVLLSPWEIDVLRPESLGELD